MNSFMEQINQIDSNSFLLIKKIMNILSNQYINKLKNDKDLQHAIMLDTEKLLIDVKNYTNNIKKIKKSLETIEQKNIKRKSSSTVYSQINKGNHVR